MNWLRMSGGTVERQRVQTICKCYYVIQFPYAPQWHETAGARNDCGTRGLPFRAGLFPDAFPQRSSKKHPKGAKALRKASVARLMVGCVFALPGFT